MGGGGLPYQRPNVVETKYIVKKNGPMGTSNQANAAASFFAKAHQKLQLNNNGLHDLSLRNNGGQGCSPASSRRFQVSSNMMFSTRVLKYLVKWAPTATNNLALWVLKDMEAKCQLILKCLFLCSIFPKKANKNNLT